MRNLAITITGKDLQKQIRNQKEYEKLADVIEIFLIKHNIEFKSVQFSEVIDTKLFIKRK